jgi:hypothetical protein
MEARNISLLQSYDATATVCLLQTGSRSGKLEK